MKIIPVIRCSNMTQALSFYTGILDFALKYPGATADEPVLTLVQDEAEIQLSIWDGLPGTTLNVRVDNVDERFQKYLQRGLDVSGYDNSPVHRGPLDQTWGMREFYVTDIDGNTLRFGQPFSLPKAYFINAWPYKDDALNLPVKNVREAVPFYVNVMNFRLVSTHKSPIVSAVLERDAITIGLAENGGDPSQEGCFFEVDNVLEAHKELALNGLAKELSPVKLDKHGETSWKLFFVIAPDGLCYSIGERQVG